MSSKHTKRALLSSVLSLVLCFSMLLGATFAWFTDTATTSVNTIQAGTLDVALEMKNGDGEWVSAEGQTLNFKKATGAPAGEAILWEPGCTYSLPTVRVVNNGNLALKYTVVVSATIGEGNKLAEVLDLYVGETKVGTLKDALTSADPDGFAHGELLADQNSGEITLALHMQESAGNEYQGKSIDGIAITVYATQLDAEYDSFNNTYDASAPLPDVWDGTEPSTDSDSEDVVSTVNPEDGSYHISTAAQFINYIKSAGAPNPFTIDGVRYDNAKVVLDNDIDLGGYEFTRTGEAYQFSGKFDGQGYTVSNFKITRTDGRNFTALFGYFGAMGSVKNLTVKNANVTSNGEQVGVIAPGLNDNSVVENCRVVDSTVKGAKQVGGVVGYTSNSTVKNCKAENCTIICTTGENYPDYTPATKQVGAVVGFINAGSTVAGNTDSNCTIITTADGTYVAPGVTYGDSTYYISSAAGLNWFNDQVNNHRNNFNYQTVKLTADINYNNGTWLPAGQNYSTEDYPTIGYANTVEFRGTFDGQNHTISNIKIGMTAAAVNSLNDTASGTTDHEISSVGFFGYTCGTVKNLTLDNATVTGFHNVGGIVGYTDTTSYIENCHVKNSSISCTHLTDDQCGDKAGGIVGYLNNNVTGADIKGCSVSNTTITAGRDAGQVVGCRDTNAEVDSCTATSVTLTADTSCTHTSHGTNMAGGIVGRVA